MSEEKKDLYSGKTAHITCATTSPTTHSTIAVVAVSNFRWQFKTLYYQQELVTTWYSHCWPFPRLKYWIHPRTSGQTVPVTGATSGPHWQSSAKPVDGKEKALKGSRNTKRLQSTLRLPSDQNKETDSRRELPWKVQGQVIWTWVWDKLNLNHQLPASAVEDNLWIWGAQALSVSYILFLSKQPLLVSLNLMFWILSYFGFAIIMVIKYAVWTWSNLKHCEGQKDIWLGLLSSELFCSDDVPNFLLEE